MAMREPDPMLVAVRAYAPLGERRKARRRRAHSEQPSVRRPRAEEAQRHPAAVLVLDAETTLDAAQGLILGAYRYCRVHWDAGGPTLSCVEEGLFYPDDLPSRDPSVRALLERYVERSAATTDGAARDARRALRLLNRSEFVRKVLLAALHAKATVVGFNLPFDLARLAVGWGVAEMEGFEGGFSLVLGEYVDDAGLSRQDTAVPRQLIRSFDARRARMRLGTVRPGSNPYARGSGSFLDLCTLSQPLSGERQTLESACAEFGVPYRKPSVELGLLSPLLIDYCRADVTATAALYVALASEYERWHLQRAPTRIYSGASLAKAIIREARIPPILQRQRFPESALGHAMTAYAGGRAEAHIRCHPVPVATLDFRSMYPTVAALSGLSEFLTCEEIGVERLGRAARAELQAWLDAVTVERCLDPASWPRLNAFVLVEPQGEILPVRARYAPYGGYGIGVNPLWSEEPLWFTLADTVASSLLTGRAPRILQAFRLVPRGRLPHLRALRIRDARPIDPGTEDVFRALVEERRRLEAGGDAAAARTAAALKVVANCLSYGIWGELNRQEPAAKPTRLAVNGLDRFYADVAAVETPGEYFFGPLAALVAGGARLMLALLERLVTDAGGTWATCDTDSMAVVSTHKGGLVVCPGGPERDEAGRQCVRALGFEQVDEIVSRFAALNPYERSAVPGSVLSLEPENFDATGGRRQLHCYAISAKRYCLFTHASGTAAIVKASKHALGGVYLDPRDPGSERQVWVEEAWAWILARDGLGIEGPEPAWLDRPALTRFTASHPRLLRPFLVSEGLPYATQVKPFGFLLVAHPAPGGVPSHGDPDRFVLVAPYESDPARWVGLDWRNIYEREGLTYHLETRSVFERRGYALPRDAVAVLTYRDVLRRFRSRPESKSDAPRARGLLGRRPVRGVPPVVHIGKEANFLEEAAAGIAGRDEELTVYAEDDRGRWTADCVAVLKEMNVRETARAVGVDPTTITRIRAGARPRRTLRAQLGRVIARHARAELRAGGVMISLDDEAAVRVYARFSSTPRLPA